MNWGGKWNGEDPMHVPLKVRVHSSWAWWDLDVVNSLYPLHSTCALCSTPFKHPCYQQWPMRVLEVVRVFTVDGAFRGLRHMWFCKECGEASNPGATDHGD